MGGRDSSGNIAENLRPRVAAKLKEYYGDTRAHELGAVDWNVDDLVMVNNSKTGGEDTMPQWWNTIMETEAEVLHSHQIMFPHVLLFRFLGRLSCLFSAF